MSVLHCFRLRTVNSQLIGLEGSRVGGCCCGEFGDILIFPLPLEDFYIKIELRLSKL